MRHPYTPKARGEGRFYTFRRRPIEQLLASLPPEQDQEPAPDRCPHQRWAYDSHNSWCVDCGQPRLPSYLRRDR